MKRRTLIVLLVLLLIGAAVFFFWFRPRANNQKVAFTTSKVTRGYVAESITATGTVQPVDTVSVGAQVSGVVRKVYVDFNDPVKTNQLLAEVDPSIVNEQVNQAKATLGNAQSNFSYQQKNFDRQAQLYQLGAISKAEYQATLNQLEVSKAAVSSAMAQLRLTQRNLFYTNIYSPINGVVLNRNVSAGQTIASSFNAPTLFVIAKDLTHMQVNANIDEADIGGVKEGLRVNFSVDAFPDEVFTGKVQTIRLHPAFSANVVTYTTLISVENSAMKLRPGMTASITVFTQEDSNALLIPAKALNFKPDTTQLKNFIIKRFGRQSTKMTSGNRTPLQQKEGTATDRTVQHSFVWVRNADTLTERPILTGMSDGNVVKVIRGLQENEEVITGMVVGKATTTAASTKSPFMPQMPNRRQQGQPAR